MARPTHAPCLVPLVHYLASNMQVSALGASHASTEDVSSESLKLLAAPGPALGVRASHPRAHQDTLTPLCEHATLQDIVTCHASAAAALTPALRDPAGLSVTVRCKLRCQWAPSRSRMGPLSSLPRSVRPL